mmetsp:Transcript_113229/g.315294  ORF Transcript_113229/g.315294 Transcript_113229/m.315294 type:complete len:149 (+) Transcript_113229:186-632(+)
MESGNSAKRGSVKSDFSGIRGPGPCAEQPNRGSLHDLRSDAARRSDRNSSGSAVTSGLSADPPVPKKGSEEGRVAELEAEVAELRRQLAALQWANGEGFPMGPAVSLRSSSSDLGTIPEAHAALEPGSGCFSMVPGLAEAEAEDWFSV